MCLVKEFVCDLIVPHWKKFFVIIFATIAHIFLSFLLYSVVMIYLQYFLDFATFNFQG